jgi:hypothetical protein
MGFGMKASAVTAVKSNACQTQSAAHGRRRRHGRRNASTSRSRREEAAVHPAPGLSLRLGQVVRRGTDLTDAVLGVVIGVLFVPADQAIVRWCNKATSFESVDALVEVRELA